MKFVADLHLHSKYSRAVSQEMVLTQLANWAKIKGISVVASADFTHPFWFERLKNELVEAGNGLYKLKSTVHSSQFTVRNREPVYFLLSCEISSIYSQGGKGRRIHNLFFFPSLSSVEKFNGELLKRGANLRSDGRPMVGLSARDLAQIALSVDDKALIIPAHAWTPWFSIFGSFSGFDSISECFGDMAPAIRGIETGLSSDPAMNWRIGDLEGRAILSFSDAHSLLKMGREATVFEAEEISYEAIYKAIAEIPSREETPLAATRKILPNYPKIAFTIEFYPEEGKYHFTGHRDCNFSLSPEETAKRGDNCPVCSRKLTIGVMHRVEELASTNLKQKIQRINGVRWIYPEDDQKPPYVALVPLDEILAEALASGVGTKKVMDQYFSLINAFGSEFNVLLKAKADELSKTAPARVVEGIEKVRAGNIEVVPGYDGKFGIVKIWPQETTGPESSETNRQQGEIEGAQLNLFAR